jgi:predicted ATPase
MKLRIENFRSLKDTKDIEVKPITILVGRNSSGKSSFLRTFPMLKQSTEEKTISPILLYGNYVDFGSYKDIKPHYSEDDKDFYKLSFTLDSHYLESISSRIYGEKRRYGSLKKNHKVKYSLQFKESRKQLIQISDIRYEALNNKLKISLNQDSKKIESIIVNGRKIYKNDDKLIFFDRGEFTVDIYNHKKSSEARSRFQIAKKFFLNKAVDYISQFLHGGTNIETRQRLFSSIKFNNDEDMLLQIKRINYPKGFNKKINHWTTTTSDFIELRDYVFLNEFFSTKASINSYLKTLFLNIHYIAPLRATAERYYRIQHLAVDEVDSNGKNLPAFLESLTDGQLNSFQKWTHENFNFKTKISKIEGHYSIKIEHEDGYEINLSDMGFGYSQILPILTQIWHSTNSSFRNRHRSVHSKDIEKIIVIEQPELHLHPEFQTKFADAISRIITDSKNSGIDVKLIIETHSDIIINRLGDCVLNDFISNEDINIVIFNKENESSPTDVSTSYYDIDGNLINWPIGFFQASI